LLFISITQFASAQQVITLKRATELVLQNNLQIKQAQLSEALSDETVKQSKLALYPTLNASNNLNLNFGRSNDPLTNQFVNQSLTSTNGSLFSSVTLFQGFQKINQIAQNKFDLEADKSYTQKVRNDLLLAVVNNYLLVLNNQDLLVASRQQYAITNLQLDREQKYFDVGSKTLADLSQAKAQLATAELNVTNAQNQVDISFLNLAQLLELDPASRFEVEKPDISEIKQANSISSSSEIYQTALKNYPDIRLAELRLLAWDKAVYVAKGNFYPRLVMQGSLGSGYSSVRQRLLIPQPQGATSPVLEKTPFGDQINENFNQSIGFGLSIPLFNGYFAKSSVRRAKINYQNAQINVQVAKNTLNKTINQAVLDLRAAEKRLSSTQFAFQSSKEAFNVIEQRYNVGLVNSLDFNQAQTNLNKAQFDEIQAKYDFIFRSKVIDYYLGNTISF
jgi:outer membrane protein